MQPRRVQTWVLQYGSIPRHLASEGTTDLASSVPSGRWTYRKICNEVYSPVFCSVPALSVSKVWAQEPHCQYMGCVDRMRQQTQGRSACAIVPIATNLDKHDFNLKVTDLGVDCYFGNLDNSPATDFKAHSHSLLDAWQDQISQFFH